MRELLRSPELKVVLFNALTQPLGAIVLALGIIIGLFIWPPFLLIGVLGYAAIVVSSLNDEAENRRVVQAELHPPRKIDLNRLSGAYRQALQQIVSTQRQIDDAVVRSDARIRDTLKRLTADVDDLVGAAYDIALQAQDVQASMTQMNRTALAAEIASQERQLLVTPEGYLRSQYQATLDAKRQQMDNLDAVSEALRRWQAQLSHAQASLGEILTQILKIKSSAVLTATFDTDGISDNLREQTTALRETAKAFDRLNAERV
jgi:hypothetical protein